MYDTDKLDKPKEAFKRVKDCGKAGLISLAYDPHNNVLLAGSLDGVLRVWSVEGRWGGQAVCTGLEWSGCVVCKYALSYQSAGSKAAHTLCT